MDISDSDYSSFRPKYVRIRKRPSSPSTWMIPDDLPVVGLKVNLTVISSLTKHWNKWLYCSDEKKERIRQEVRRALKEKNTIYNWLYPGS